MPMTSVTSPRPASTRSCRRSSRRVPAPRPMSVPARTAPTLIRVPVIAVEETRSPVTSADVLIVSLSGTSGLREADEELAASLRRAGATVAVVRAERVREWRTFALIELAWALSARRAARQGIAEHAPRAVVYSSTTAALLAPRPGAIRFDAPAAGNRPG